MDLGSLELQIFVSLTVVLGGAFVALICDYLKGNNEQLREHNIELRVRKEEQDRRLLLDPVSFTQQPAQGAARSMAHLGNPVGAHEMMQSFADPDALEEAEYLAARLQDRSEGEYYGLADVPPLSTRPYGRGRSSRGRRRLHPDDARARGFGDWVRPEVMANVARKASATPEETPAPPAPVVPEPVTRVESIPAEAPGAVEATKEHLEVAVERAVRVEPPPPLGAAPLQRPLTVPALTLESELQRVAAAEAPAPAVWHSPLLEEVIEASRMRLPDHPIVAVPEPQVAMEEDPAPPMAAPASATLVPVDFTPAVQSAMAPGAPLEPVVALALTPPSPMESPVRDWSPAVAGEAIDTYTVEPQFAKAVASNAGIFAGYLIADAEVQSPVSGLGWATESESPETEPEHVEGPAPEAVAAPGLSTPQQFSDMIWEPVEPEEWQPQVAAYTSGLQDGLTPSIEPPPFFDEPDPIAVEAVAEAAESPQYTSWESAPSEPVSETFEPSPSHISPATAETTPEPPPFFDEPDLITAEPAESEPLEPSSNRFEPSPVYAAAADSELTAEPPPVIDEPNLVSEGWQPMTAVPDAAPIASDPEPISVEGIEEEAPSAWGSWFTGTEQPPDEQEPIAAVEPVNEPAPPPFWPNQRPAAAPEQVTVSEWTELEFVASEPATDQVTVSIPRPAEPIEARALPLPAGETVASHIPIQFPNGLFGASEWDRLAAQPGTMSGILVIVAIADTQSMPGLATPIDGSIREPQDEVVELMSTFVREGDFGSRISSTEWVFVYKQDAYGLNQRRVGLISEKLWDFKLRHLGLATMTFRWGAVDVQEESPAAALEAARERMRQSSRGRKLPTGDRGAARVVVNA